MSDFAGLNAIVTGGASGIGLAVAQRLFRGGAQVACVDLNPDGLPSTLVAVTADVGDDTSVIEAVAQAERHFGGVDILVNCAGIGAVGGIDANSDDEWHRVLDINVVGLARVTRAALPALRRSAHPAIVNIASVAASVGIPDRAVYSASKGAVVALSRAMAADLLSDGIRVNVVNPGTADTAWVNRLLGAAADPEAERAALEARQPHGRLVSADEVADAVAYLASPASGSTTGAVIAVDGGMASLRTRPKP